MSKSFSTKIITCACFVGFYSNAYSASPEDEGIQDKKAISRNHSYSSSSPSESKKEIKPVGKISAAIINVTDTTIQKVVE